MTAAPFRKDLVALVADQNTHSVLTGLLSRPQAFSMRPVTFDVLVHPQRDPGCLRRAHTFLGPFRSAYGHALVVLDREGSGSREASREDLETQIEGLLVRCGWGECAAAIVIDPELESWVWSDSPHVESVLGWKGRSPDLRTWLAQQGHNLVPEAKPDRPKEAVERTLREVRKPRSSALYRELAIRVSTLRCTDPAFGKLRRVLRAWFPLPG